MSILNLNNSRTLAVAAIALAAGVAAYAQPASGAAPSGTSSAGSSVARADHNFVEKAAKGGMAEVELGNLAQQRAANDQVKQFGARMVTDHTKANDELKSIASAKGITLPAPGKGEMKDMDKFGKMTGTDFDKAYMKHMVSDHKKDVSLFEKESKSGKDPELKAFAAKTLPTLREHLQLAQQVNDAVKSAK